MGADLRELNELLKKGELSEARARLDALPAAPEVEVRRIQCDLYDGTLSAEAAMEALVAIMRADQHTPGAKEVYMEAARLEHSEGHSSMAYSHPPPPPSKF